MPQPIIPKSSLPGRAKLLLRWLPVLIPPLLLAGLISHWQVDSWLSDDWMLADLMARAKTGSLTLHDFTAVQMEHRLVLPRLIAVPALLWSGGDLRILNWVAWGLQVAALGSILTLLAAAGREQWRRSPAVAFVISLALFSPVQWQSFLWPICFTIQLPLTLLLLAITVLAQPRLHAWLRLGLAWLFAAGGALSFASGLPALFTLPLAVAGGLGGLTARQRRNFCGIWAVLTAVFFLLYFHNFRNEAHPDHSFKQGDEITLGHHLKAFAADPARSFHFILTLLGGPLARGLYLDPRSAAPVLGGLLIATTLILAWPLLRRWKTHPELRQAAWPFILLTGFGIGASVMVAMGRVWVNTNTVTPALLDRYVVYGLATVAGLAGWALVLRGDPQIRKTLYFRGRACHCSGLILTGVLAVNWAYCSRVMEEWSAQRWRYKAAVLFVNVLPFPGLWDVEDSQTSLKAWANELNDHHLLHPPLLKETRLEQFHIRGVQPAPPPHHMVAHNRISHLSWRRLPEGRLSLHTEGVARGSRNRTADLILMSWRPKGGGPRTIAGVHMMDGPPLWLYKTSQIDWMYVHHRFGRTQDSFATFCWDAPVDRLPTGPVELEFWSFNAERMEATALNEPQTVEVDPGFEPKGQIITEAVW